MNLYSIGVTLYATVYIKAEDEKEALQKATHWFQNESFEVSDSQGKFSELTFDDPNLPEVSISPSLDAGEFTDNEVELAEKNIPNE
jgi:hypothetical protein